MSKSKRKKKDANSRGGRGFQRGIVAGLMALACAVPLCFSPLFHEYEIPKLVLFQTLTMSMAALWVVGMVLEGEVYILDTPLYYTFLGFLAVHFISLFQATNVFQGLDSLFRYLCYFLIPVLVFHTVRSERRLRLLAGTMALTGGLVAIVGLLQHNRIADFYARWSIPISTIGNVNFVAEYYDVVFPISLALIFLLRNFWLRVAALLACFLMSCHLVVLGSRGGWLGAGVALAVMAAMVLLRHFQVGRRILDVAVVLVVVLGLSWPVAARLFSDLPVGEDRTLGGLTADYWQRMVDRTGDALKLQDDSSQQRVLLWEDTLRLIFARPLVGVGVGNFEYHVPRYTSRQSLEVKRRMEARSGQELMAYRAHNEYLEVWAETGILGFGVFCFLLYQIVAALYGLLKRYVHNQESLLAVGLVAAIAATLAHAFFSTNLQDPASAVCFWLAVGMVWSLKLNAEGETRLGLLFTEGSGVAFGLISISAAALIATVAMGVQTLLGAYYYRIGTLWFKRENYVQAVAALERAAEYRYTNDFAVYQDLGMALYNQQRWDEAAQAFRQSLLRHRNNATVYHFLGLSLGLAGDHRAAVEPLRRAVELNPLSMKYRVEYGKALGLTGKHAEAIRALGEALRMDPNAADAHHALGANYRRAGNLEAAVLAYREALALKPGDAEILNSLAVVYSQKGDFEAAREIFQQLVDGWPDRPGYWANLGVARLNLGRLQEALDACQEALKLDPEFARAYAVAGSVWETAGDLARAGVAYREALRREPDNAAVQERLRALEGRR